MQAEYDSPFFTEFIDTDDANLTSLDHHNADHHNADIPLIDKLHQLYPNKLDHMKLLVNMYKFCFTNKAKTKPNEEKTTSDIVDEIANTPISLNLGNMMKEQADELKRQMFDEKMFPKKIAVIPAFIDAAFIYYIWSYDQNAPILKLPNTVMKYQMLLQAVNSQPDAINMAFLECLTNPFITDLRIESPPFLMRSELTKAEIKEKIENVVKPICKTIINGLLKLEKNNTVITTLSAGVEEISVAEVSVEESRDNNLEF